MKIAFSPIYRYDLPSNHRFPMVKYELLPEQLLYEGTVLESDFFRPSPLDDSIILQTHTDCYWNRLKTQTLSAKEIRAIGFPMRPELVERGRHIAGGTLQCARFARRDGVALNIAGGTHHAFSDRGEGFCLLNDIAIAATHLLATGEAHRILIIDLDVHQGNGTARIFRQEDRVFTFSMHGAKNYPLRKETSDLDVPLPDGTTDSIYLQTMDRLLPDLLDSWEPDLVFYLSGVDVLASDRLGRLALSLHACRERDRRVFQWCRERAIPVAVSMGGGYSTRVAQVVDAHANTFRMARAVFY